jgi:fimbrial chaperone protein
MRPALRALQVLFLLAVVVPGQAAEAGTLKISPLRAVLSGDGGSAQFLLRNDSERKIAVQAEAAGWTMDEKGEDVLGAASDLVFFPKIFELEPGAEGVVRVGWTGRGSPPTERAYRLFARELPSGAAREEGVRMTLTLSVPVFVAPVKPFSSGRVEAVSLGGGRVSVRVGNGGNSHLRIEKVVCVGRDGQGVEVFRAEVPGWYVLGGAARDFLLDVPPERCAQAVRIEAEAVWEEGRAQGAAEVSADGCAPPPGSAPR